MEDQCKSLTQALGMAEPLLGVLLEAWSLALKLHGPESLSEGLGAHGRL